MHLHRSCVHFSTFRHSAISASGSSICAPWAVLVKDPCWLEGASSAVISPLLTGYLNLHTASLCRAGPGNTSTAPHCTARGAVCEIAHVIFISSQISVFYTEEKKRHDSLEKICGDIWQFQQCDLLRKHSVTS